MRLRSSPCCSTAKQWKGDSPLICALRYIHANPEPAGICAAADYPWSSYGAYLGAPSFVTTSFALELLGGVEGFIRFSASGSKLAVPFPGSRLRGHLSSDELMRIAVGILGRDTINWIKSYPKSVRDDCVRKLKAAGFTMGEISRITGLGDNIIRAA